MLLELSEQQADELADLLDGSVREMSHEIAATDNSLYRVGLIQRRDALREVLESLRAQQPG